LRYGRFGIPCPPLLANGFSKPCLSTALPGAAGREFMGVGSLGMNRWSAAVSRPEAAAIGVRRLYLPPEQVDLSTCAHVPPARSSSCSPDTLARLRSRSVASLRSWWRALRTRAAGA
jgi:hypothetical protein